MRLLVGSSLTLVSLLMAMAACVNQGVSTGPRTATSPAVRFREVSRRSGIIRDRMNTWGSVFVDYDRDGDPDLMAGNHKRKPFFYINHNGKFVHRKFRALGRPAPGRNYYDQHSCAWGEANRDGLPDLYCQSGAQKGGGVGPNRLFIQNGSKLVNRARRYRVVDKLGRGRSLNWLDYNRDGKLDVFVGNQLRPGMPNALFRRGRRGFVGARSRVVRDLETLSSSWADWNVDGRPDLLLTTYTGRVLAYRNTMRGFRMEQLGRLTRGRWSSTSWGDFNGDGHPDVAAVSATSLAIFKNKRGRFRAIERRRLHHGHGVTWLDVDNDGLLDLFVVQGSTGRFRSFNFPDFFMRFRKGHFRRVKRGGFRGPSRGNGDSASAGDFNGDGRVDLFVSNGYSCLRECPGHTSRGRPSLLRNNTRAANWAFVDLRGLRRNPLAFGARLRVRLKSGRTYWREINDGVSFRTQSATNPVHLGLNKSPTARVQILWPNGDRDCITVPANTTTVLRRETHRCP
jgi:hypothetical protein